MSKKRIKNLKNNNAFDIDLQRFNLSDFGLATSSSGKTSLKSDITDWYSQITDDTIKNSFVDSVKSKYPGLSKQQIERILSGGEGTSGARHKIRSAYNDFLTSGTYTQYLNTQEDIKQEEIDLNEADRLREEAAAAAAAYETGAFSESEAYQQYLDEYGSGYSDEDSIYMREYRRAAEQQETEAKADIAREMAQRGVSGGSYDKSLARLRESMAGAEQSAIETDIARYENEALTEEATAYSRYLTDEQRRLENVMRPYSIYSEEFQTIQNAYQQEMDNYYNLMALRQNEALQDWQESQMTTENLLSGLSILTNFIPSLL